MIRFLRPFAAVILVGVILTFGQIIADLSLPNYLANIVDRGIAVGDTSYILDTGVVMLLISIFGVACAITAGYLASKTALGIGRNLRLALFSKVTSFSLAELNTIGTASLITRTTNDVQQIQQTVFMMLRMMLRAPLMCIGGLILAVRKDGELSLILFSAMPIVIVVIFVILRKAMPLFRKLQRQLDRMNLVLRENLTGMRIVRAFSRVGYEKRRFGKVNGELTDTSLRINRLMILLDPMMTIVMNGLPIAIVWAASFRVDRGELMVGDMLAFIQYAMMIFMAFMMLSMLFVLLPRAFASWERIRDVINTQTTINDPELPVPAPKGKGELVFDNVTFRYSGAEMPAICNISFTALPGQRVAIIGGTGSGKSAIVSLIPRYYDIEQGQITIDGVDIARITQHDLRAKIGYVPQKAVLFSGTIEDNIKFGYQEATMEQVRRACDIAQASQFIDSLPDGYQSHVAQGGANFSGGQKQRLSIARAIVKSPELYIFDDSFSALDTKTDAALQAALGREVSDATFIVVAQRVASIMNADKIIVLDAGRIAGVGSHGELMASCDIYREIVKSQLTAEQA